MTSDFICTVPAWAWLQSCLSGWTQTIYVNGYWWCIC